MATGVPIFRANSNAEQLIEIIKVLGTPSAEEILKMNPKCDVNSTVMLPKLPKKDWNKVRLY
jgi:glycogen synthase kinase 3 beta